MTPTNVTDPDAELRRNWLVANRTAPDDESPELGAALDHAALEAVARLRPQTLAGLSVKVQALIADLLDGETPFSPELIATTLDALDRMAPGSVIFRPTSRASETPQT